MIQSQPGGSSWNVGWWSGDFVVAVVAGIAAGSIDSRDTTMVLYAVSSLGWVVATSTLSVRHASAGETLAAAGFLILTVAECLLWVSGRVDHPDYESGFAGGVMFYAPGMFLVAAATVYPRLVRTLAAAAGVVWTVAAASFLTGTDLTHDDTIALVGYTVLSAAFIGVGITVLNRSKG